MNPDVFASQRMIVALQTDTVIGSINVAVVYLSIRTVVEVYSVIIPIGAVMDGNMTDLNILTSVDRQSPTGAVAQRETFYQNPIGVIEEEKFRT